MPHRPPFAPSVITHPAVITLERLQYPRQLPYVAKIVNMLRFGATIDEIVAANPDVLQKGTINGEPAVILPGYLAATRYFRDIEDHPAEAAREYVATFPWTRIPRTPVRIRVSRLAMTADGRLDEADGSSEYYELTISIEAKA